MSKAESTLDLAASSEHGSIDEDGVAESLSVTTDASSEYES